MSNKNNTSPGHVLQRVYDETNEALRTTATAVISGTINVELDAADGDNVAISDGVNTLAINPDGSINTNLNVASLDIELSAADGDNVAISDGTNTLAVNPDGSLNVSGVATEVSLASLNSKFNTLGQKTAANSVPVVLASDQSNLNVDVVSSSSDAILTTISTNIANLPTDNNGLAIGTENGLIGGTQRVFVNNLKEQILSTADRIAVFSYLDFGTKNQRVDKIEYTSVTIPGTTVVRTFNYTLVGTKYRRDTEVWSLI